MLLLTYAVGQTPAEPGTAFTNSLGGIVSTNEGIHALFTNAAGMAQDSGLVAMAGYYTLFSLPELTTIQLGGFGRYRKHAVGMVINRFGMGNYHQHQYSMAYAHQLNRVSLGAKITYVQVGTTGFNSRRQAVISVGGISKLIPKLTIGAYAYNLNRASINKELDDYLPTYLHIGLAWQAAKVLTVYSELTKTLDYNTQSKFGLAYQVKPFASLQAGFSTEPSTTHFGLSLQRKKFGMQYAGLLHQYLGLRHHISFLLRVK